MVTDLVISKLDTARLALSEAKTIQETKKILDIAAAAEIYAKRQQLGDDAIHYATSIKVEALAQLGRMLKETPRNTGVRMAGSIDGLGGTILEPPSNIPTLAEMGLDKKTSKLAQDIAALPDDQIEKIKSGVVAISRATSSANRQDRVEQVQKLSVNNSELKTDKLYPVIYADPPWRYEHSISNSREIENQYPTMELDDICALPVGDIAARDAILFIWATSPKLTESLRVVEAWGFNYRTNMVWVKDKIGMGYYARQRHELLLIATRGELPTPEPANRPDSVMEFPRTEHSKKPFEVYEIIEKMYPEYSKLELFARERRDNWEVWGNEV
jgi:N6-adenosine-specific RNA methylase IME4